MTRENNQAAGKTWVYTYDNGGNITSKSEYPYSAGELGTQTSIVYYTYTQDNWRDKLVQYGDNAITTDEIGNILSDGIRTYAWVHGRELRYLSDGTTTWHNSYNADGLRFGRVDGTNSYYYIYDGNKNLSRLMNNNQVMDFVYSGGTPVVMIFNDSVYFYATNLQGDVVAILDASGNPVVEYTYDAWGKILTTTGSMASTLGVRNPLRYRGYVYDTQSRYYDPEIGRFINADAFASTGQGLLGNNMFAYCGNNPIINVDPTGHAFGAIIGGIVGGILGGITAVASGKSVAAGITTGAITGAIVGGICDGTTWAVAAVAGAMAKCAAVAAGGNLVNQYINYQLEKNSNQSNKPIETTTNLKKQSSVVSQGSKNISRNVAQTQPNQNFAEYVDYGDIIKSAVTTAIFAPLSVGGGHIVNSVFSGATQGIVTKATQFIAETAMGSNVSMLQTATEFIIQIFE